jgi:restriction system protein
MTVPIIPKYGELITVTFKALKELGGSGKNDEINEKAAELLDQTDASCSVPHLTQ